MMMYGSWQDEFVQTKHNGNFHRHGTPIFGNSVVYVSKAINDDKILWKL